MAGRVGFVVVGLLACLTFCECAVERHCVKTAIDSNGECMVDVYRNEKVVFRCPTAADVTPTNCQKEVHSNGDLENTTALPSLQPSGIITVTEDAITTDAGSVASFGEIETKFNYSCTCTVGSYKYTYKVYAHPEAHSSSIKTASASFVVSALVAALAFVYMAF